jgi:hypothetical protein
MKAVIALLLVLAVVPACAGLAPMELAQLKGLRAVTVKVEVRLQGFQDYLVKDAHDRGLTEDGLRPIMSTSLRDAGVTVPDTTGSATLKLDVLLNCNDRDGNEVLGYMRLSLTQDARLERDSSPTLGQITIGDSLLLGTTHVGGFGSNNTSLLLKDVEAFTQLQTDAFISYCEASNAK